MNFARRRICLWLVPLTAACLALVQAAMAVVVDDDWSLSRWDASDGLPVNSINAMVRDEHGYLWLATMDGLVRFDGLHFEIFNAHNTPGLAGNRLLVLERDPTGALWMATEDTRLIRRANGRFQTLDDRNGLPAASVIALSVAESVWVGTTRGAARWTGEHFDALPVEQWQEATTAITQAPDGTVWLGARNGQLARVGPAGQWSTAQVDGRVWQLLLDGDSVWVAHEAGLSRWNQTGLESVLGEGQPVHRMDRVAGQLVFWAEETLYRLEHDQPVRLQAGQAGSRREPLARVSPDGLWLITRAGLALDGRSILESDRGITSWIADNDGSLLLGTGGDGLYRLSRRIVRQPAGALILNEASVYPIVRGPDQRLWFGTSNDGLYVLEPDGGPARRVAEDGLPGTIMTVLPAEHGRLWVGGEGLWLLEGNDAGQPGVPETLREEMILALFKDRSGRLWIGTRDHGLWLKQAGRWMPAALPQHWANAAVRVIAEDNDQVWFAGKGAGLMRYRDGVGFKEVLSGSSAPGRLIRALHFGPQGRLWIGTENLGLCRLDTPAAEAIDPDRVRCLDQDNGLPHHGIHQVLDDGQGRWWMSTNQGVFSVGFDQIAAAFDGALLSPRLFTEADGMADREANGGVQSAGTVDHLGRIWFPTMRGPVMIDPARIDGLAPAPAAVISAVILDQKSLPVDGPRLELPVNTGRLSVQFTAPEFSRPEQLLFEVRGLGGDPDWQALGTRREVDFTNLSPGQFRLEVRARLSSAAPGPATALTLIIPPRFYQTGWFRALIGLVLASLALLAWRWRERRLQAQRARLETLVAQRTRDLAAERDRSAQQAQRLEQLDQEKRAFFANISHELRTPLTLLLGPLEEVDPGSDALVEQLPLMRRNARRMHRLVEQILDLQRIEAGQLTIKPEIHDLGAWTRASVALFEPLSQRRRLTLTLRIDSEGVLAWFDAAQMEKVLGNLLSNAIKYCGAGDAIEVLVERDGELARIIVSDTGPGIAPEHVPKLFDRFFRAALHDGAVEGTGIGLALARDLMALHGGSIEVHSQPGQGTAFTLQWPAQARAGQLVPEPCQAALPAGSKAPAHPAATPHVVADAPRVLVVDDNEDLRHWLSHSLGGRFTVDTADNGHTALGRLADRLPDLIISDWMMPGMDGLELIERVQRHPDWQGIPVILLTARSDVADQLKALDAGAVAFVPKPFRIDLLIAQIDSLLGLRLRLRQIFADRQKPIDADPADAEPTDAGPTEASWMSRVQQLIDQRLHEPDFDVEALAIGRTGLFRRLKQEADISPSALLREARMNRARHLLGAGAGNVSEIAYAVGFNSLDGFSRAYRKAFGAPPSIVANTRYGTTASLFRASSKPQAIGACATDERFPTR